jgi:hypothetical protein
VVTDITDQLAAALRAIVDPAKPDKWGYGAAHNAFDDNKRAAAIEALRAYDEEKSHEP